MATTETHLYRSVRKESFPDGVIVNEHAVPGVLYPSFEDSSYQVCVDGKTQTRTRLADVYPYTHEGQEVVEPGGGASLFDKSGLFGAKHWWYFHIPEGTVIPDSLRVRHTGYNPVYEAEHYQIEAAMLRMPLDAYKGALDNLARNAIVKRYKDAR